VIEPTRIATHRVRSFLFGGGGMAHGAHRAGSSAAHWAMSRENARNAAVVGVAVVGVAVVGVAVAGVAD